MESIRQKKISRLLQKDIGEIIAVEGIGNTMGAMITVTKVYVTSDLSMARVFLSIFAPGGKEKILKKVQQQSGEIRFKLGRRIKNQLKNVPELNFFMDDSLDYIENIENLLNDDK